MAVSLGDDLDVNFKLGGDQVDRLYLGSSFVWPQHPIDDFEASNDLVKKLRFTWTDSNSPLPTSYDLYENDVRIYAGIVNNQELEAEVGVAEYNIRSLYPGGHGIDSNKNIGEALSGIAPGPITDFRASRDQTLQCQFWWTNATGDPVPTYNLFQNGNPLRSNVQSGHVESLPAGSWTFRVDAINEEGSVSSNNDTGTALEYVPPLQDYEAVYDQVGDTTFTVPPGVTSIHICAIGGGGAGGGAEYSNASFNPSGGGGYSGNEYSGDHAVTPGQVLNLTIGRGGQGRDQNSDGHHIGEQGFNTRVTTLGVSVAGGTGGNASQHFFEPGQGHQGINGAGPGGCAGGGFPDGNYGQVFINPSTWTGWGGQATSAGRGGQGYGNALVGGNAGNGTRGGGGGGSAVARTVTSRTGNGGGGYIKISWRAFKEEGEE